MPGKHKAGIGGSTVQEFSVCASNEKLLATKVEIGAVHVVNKTVDDNLSDLVWCGLRVVQKRGKRGDLANHLVPSDGHFSVCRCIFLSLAANRSYLRYQLRKSGRGSVKVSCKLV
jgi:hypothetical protein